jgi:probable F420-dependent oxidoreductase
MSLRPFRFSASVWSASSQQDWRNKVRKVEDLGFDMLVVPDHLNDQTFSPLVALASAADVSTALRLGTLVLNNDLRHPAMVAREAATLDVLSEGRFELGLGAGHMQSEYSEVGLPFDLAPHRIARLAESVRIIRRLLARETVGFEGEHYAIDGHRLFPEPKQDPLPLLVGGNGRGVLELAAREASAVGFTGFFPGSGEQNKLTHFTSEGLEDRLAIVRAAAGERFASLELHALVQAVIGAPDVRAAAQRILVRTPGHSVDDVLSSPFLLFGSTDTIVDTLLERRERFGLSHFTVFEPAIDSLAPVIARLRGR